MTVFRVPRAVRSALLLLVIVPLFFSACDGRTFILVSTLPSSPTSPTIVIVIRGVIRDGSVTSAGRPLAGVSVTFTAASGVAVTTMTDPDGQFAVESAGGSVRLMLSKAGYLSRTITMNDISSDRILDLTMMPAE
jgi:carboxypeptidase family protein